MWHGFHHIIFTSYIAYSHSIVSSSHGLCYSTSVITSCGVMLPLSCVHLINVLLYLYLCIALMTSFLEKMSPKQTTVKEDSTSLFFYAHNTIDVFVSPFYSFYSLDTSFIQFVTFHLFFLFVLCWYFVSVFLCWLDLPL